MAAPMPYVEAYDRGLALLQAGHVSAALGELEVAHRARPDDISVLFALGNAARALGLHDSAARFFNDVLSIDPDRIEATVQLAKSLAASTRHGDAIEALQRALALRSDAAVLWVTLGNVVREQGDTANAEIFLREALRLNPKSAEALGGVADLLFDAGKRKDALALYDRAVALTPDNAQLRVNRAVALLASGRAEQGWEDYEWRLRLRDKGVVRRHALTRWQGDALAGRRLLVMAEQGLGDQIAFASYLSALAAETPCIVECEPRLQPLFARSFPAARVVGSQPKLAEGRPTLDYQWLADIGGADIAIELCSLPLLRGTRPQDDERGYLAPNEGERTLWSGWLDTRSTRRRVGICWRSGKRGGLRNLQFAPLEAWGEFLRDLDADIVSVQYDAAPDEIAALSAMSGRAILVPPGLDQKNEIDRTASMLAALDAVVSAPTAVASLSAALGVPTFKVLYESSWTSLGEAHEPFAPACRCVTPAKAGDWAEVFDKTASLLRARSGEVGSGSPSDRATNQ